MSIRTVLYEALDPLNKIANSIVKKEEEINEEKMDLEQIIYDYLKSNYWSMYPLEKTAKELADKIKKS